MSSGDTDGIIRVTTPQGAPYPLPEVRFLREEIDLQVKRTADVLAAIPDGARLIETPICRPFTDLAARYHGALMSKRDSK